MKKNGDKLGQTNQSSNIHVDISGPVQLIPLDINKSVNAPGFNKKTSAQLKKKKQTKVTHSNPVQPVYISPTPARVNIPAPNPPVTPAAAPTNNPSVPSPIRRGCNWVLFFALLWIFMSYGDGIKKYVAQKIEWIIIFIQEGYEEIQKKYNNEATKMDLNLKVAYKHRNLSIHVVNNTTSRKYLNAEPNDTLTLCNLYGPGPKKYVLPAGTIFWPNEKKAKPKKLKDDIYIELTEEQINMLEFDNNLDPDAKILVQQRAPKDRKISVALKSLHYYEEIGIRCNIDRYDALKDCEFIAYMPPFLLNSLIYGHDIAGLTISECALKVELK
jgi:hypothetical protein